MQENKTKEHRENWLFDLISDKDDSECQSPPSSVVPRSARKSVTSDLFHQWLQNGSSKLDTTRFLESQGSLSAGGTPFPVSPSGPFGPANLVGKDLEMLEQNDRLMDFSTYMTSYRPK